MDEKLKALKERWRSSEPDQEYSVMAPDELVYMGRYPEGVVLRLNQDDGQITFLTNEMAARLGQRLLGEA